MATARTTTVTCDVQGCSSKETYADNGAEGAVSPLPAGWHKHNGEDHCGKHTYRPDADGKMQVVRKVSRPRKASE